MVFIDKDTLVNVCSLGVVNGDSLIVTGFSTQFNGTFELKPRFPADVVKSPLPNLSTSTKSNAINGTVRAGDLVTYTISLSNTGGANATTTVTDVLPSYYAVANELDFSQPTTGTLTWTGVVTAGQTVNVQFVARVKLVGQLPIGPNLPLFNSATVNDGLHPTFALDDPTPPMITIYGVYLPLIRR